MSMIADEMAHAYLDHHTTGGARGHRYQRNVGYDGPHFYSYDSVVGVMHRVPVPDSGDEGHNLFLLTEVDDQSMTTNGHIRELHSIANRYGVESLKVPDPARPEHRDNLEFFRDEWLRCVGKAARARERRDAWGRDAATLADKYARFVQVFDLPPLPLDPHKLNDKDKPKFMRAYMDGTLPAADPANIPPILRPGSQTTEAA